MTDPSRSPRTSWETPTTGPEALQQLQALSCVTANDREPTLRAPGICTGGAVLPGGEARGGRLTHTDGLYFAVTVFSTVGFGDITAKTEAARLVVTGQMIADLVILGLAVKIILGALSRRRQPGDADGAQPAQQTRR